MNLKQSILNYIPVNEQEAKDKEVFLKYMDTFTDVLTRENEITHFTSSAFIVNKEKNKVLMIYHNIYNSWGWVGGHADGESDLLSVAIRETEEETGVKNVNVLSDICAIDTLPVLGHVKRGKYVPAHIHLSVAYLLEADENESIRIKADENSNVAWLDLDNVINMCTEEYMKPLYKKIINKLKEI
jgi:ADP-ribose pyrophosphatase YjhB (NUDIX family)